MAAMNHNCKLTEKDEYWREFPTDKHQFFKFMVGGFRDSLRIPRSNFRENLSGTIRLRGPSGFIWTVELERESDHVLLHKGWDKFVKDHNLANCDMLVFRYDMNSTFNVTIFNSSGCVRQGTYFVNQHDACSNERCMFQKKDVKDLDKSQKNHMQNKKLKKKRGNPWSKAVPSRKKQPQVGNSGAATKQKTVVSDESEEDSMEASEDRHKESVSNLKGKSKMKEGIALQQAKALKSKIGNPSFFIVMRPTYARGDYLAIPAAFAQEYLAGIEETTLTLQVSNGKRWKEPLFNFRNFVWGDTEEKKRLHLVNWQEVRKYYELRDSKQLPHRLVVLEISAFALSITTFSSCPQREFICKVSAKGWDKFVKDHSLASGEMLVFRYDMNSTFNVTIFNSSGCERQGTYFVNQHDACSNDRCVFQKEDVKDRHKQSVSLKVKSKMKEGKTKGPPEFPGPLHVKQKNNNRGEEAEASEIGRSLFFSKTIF
ncbi:hypothetical protein COLO4_22193 [Corchorus olitorius]|uniref:TF-B3 domain-containing protein n=1 Tax=Corchorus olitorius TaxID=93759 RepID=A0A1R3INJ6_9ROSI|nr:hypothetical protein COLO4_22193 [Corchorus olitorius]